MSHVDDGTLHAYLDGELSALETARCESHLQDCAACRARLEEQRALIAQASRILEVAEPPAYEAPLFERLRARRVTWRARGPLALAATAVLAVAIVWYLRDTTPPVGQEAAAPVVASAAPEPAADRAAPAEPVAETAPAPAPAPAPPPAQPGVATGADTGRARRADTGAAVVMARDERALAEMAPRDTAAPLPFAPAVPPPPVAREARAVAPAWEPITSDAAHTLLGTAPVAVPDVPVRRLRGIPAADTTVTVEQEVDSAVVIVLHQRRRRPAEGPSGDAAREALVRWIGPLRVEISGPLPLDSLRRLLERVEPVP